MHTKLAIMMAFLIGVSPFLAPINVALATESGKNPSSSSSVNYSTFKTWSNGTDVQTSDDKNAFIVLDPNKRGQYISNYLVAKNFGFSVSGTVTGIKVDVERSASDSSIKDYKVYLSTNSCSSVIGDDKSVNSAWGASETTSTFGGSSDTWTASLNSTQINNSGFAFCYSVFNNSANAQTTAYIDHISVTVYTQSAALNNQVYNATLATHASSTSSKWVSPTNVYSSNNLYATWTNNTDDTTSPTLKVTGFFSGSAIPNTATIDGLLVGIEAIASASGSGASGNCLTIYNLQLTSNNSTAISGTDNNGAQAYGCPSGKISTSDSMYTFGALTDDWAASGPGGHALTESDIDTTNFGLLIAGGHNSATSNILSIDHVYITVQYDVPAGSITPHSASPQTVTSANVSAGSIDWNNPNYVNTEDSTTFANVTLSPGQYSDMLVAKNFGFSIPSGQTIDGIEVLVEYKASATNNISDELVTISTDGCTTLGTDDSNTGTWGTSFSGWSYSDNSSTFGLSLTNSDINSNDFSVCYVVKNSANTGSATAFVDYIRVIVYYSETPASPVLSARASATDTVTLTWDITNSTGVTAWQIKRSTNSDMSSASTINLVDPSGLLRTYDDTPLSSDTVYYYQLRAKSGGSNYSPYSNIASADTHADKISTCTEGTDCEPDSAPNGGTVQLNTPEGDIQYFRNFPTANVTNAPDDVTDWEFFEFRITGVSSNTITLTMQFSDSIPANSKFYKVVGGTVYDVTSDITSNDGDDTVYFTITDNGPYDTDNNSGTIVDPIGVGGVSSNGGTNTCAGDCYPPHLGVDQNGQVFYNDGLTINGQSFNVQNILHNSPDTIINLPVGEPVNIQIKAQDNWANQIDHCELGVAIPHGIFDKSQAAFLINVDRNFDGTIVTHDVFGDKTALKDLYVSFENIDDKTALCTISFVPTKHLQNDMFSVEVWDIFQYTGTYYFNHGIIFQGESLVGTPVYDVMDDKGRITTIAIADQTLEDLTHAVDTQGNKWTLVDGFWQKDFVSPDKTCDPKQGRSCIAFQDVIKEQQELAKKYFDGSKIQKDAPKSFTKDLYGHQTGRGPHESSNEMKWAMEITKALRFLK